MIITINDFVLSLIAGVIASILVLIGDRVLNRLRLRKLFKSMEGNYLHKKDGQTLDKCTSVLVYVGNAKIQIKSDTPYGKWNAIISMNPIIGDFGGGSFRYENRDESGYLNIQTKSDKVIFVFPHTMTHEFQKTNFYQLEKIYRPD